MLAQAYYNPSESLFPFGRASPAIVEKQSLHHEYNQYKRTFGNQHINAINFVADVATIKDLCAPHDLTINTVANNVFSAISEAQLMKIKSTNQYPLSPYQEDPFGNYVIANLEQNYHEGRTNMSGQIPAAEIRRNEENYQNYEKLKAMRKAGEYGDFIELSPSPMLTANMKERGYEGFHAWFRFKYDPVTKQEQVTQYWLKKELTWQDLTNHLKELVKQNPNILQGKDPELIAKLQAGNLNDVELMRFSGDFGIATDSLIEFTKNNAAVDDAQAGRIEGFKDQLWNQMEQEIMPVIDSAADFLRFGREQKGFSGALDGVLGKIANRIAQLQYQLKLKIEGILGKDSSEEELSRFIIAGYDDRNQELMRKRFQAIGCGFNSTFGKVDSLSIVNRDKYGDLSFKCPHCPYWNTREANTLLPNCKGCGESVQCGVLAN